MRDRRNLERFNAPGGLRLIDIALVPISIYNWCFCPIKCEWLVILFSHRRNNQESVTKVLSNMSLAARVSFIARRIHNKLSENVEKKQCELMG